MEIEKFLSFVKNAKRTNILSGYSNFKVWREAEIPHYLCNQCPRCGFILYESELKNGKIL